jgi:hypothetical protein
MIYVGINFEGTCAALTSRCYRTVGPACSGMLIVVGSSSCGSSSNAIRRPIILAAVGSTHMTLMYSRSESKSGTH